MSPTKSKDGWPTPKALGAQLTILAMVGAVMLWAGGLLYVKRTDYDMDRYNTANTLTSMAKDVEFIKSSLERIERAAARERPRGR